VIICLFQAFVLGRVTADRRDGRRDARHAPKSRDAVAALLTMLVARIVSAHDWPGEMGPLLSC
jgi:hypothetical protein